MAERMRSQNMSFFRATIAALLLIAAGTTAVRADDHGSRRGIREVRAAVPILVDRDMRQLYLGRAVVDDAIVESDHAIVDFHGDRGRGIAVLSYKNATWWLVGSAFEERHPGRSWWTTDSPGAPASCKTTTSVTPTADALRAALGADAATASLWSLRAMPQPTSSSAPTPAYVGIPQACAIGATYIVNGYVAIANDAGYRVSWTSPKPFDLADPHGRAPDDAEMSGPGANSIFYLYANGGKGSSGTPASTLIVWCPFVLDTSVHYIIEFSGADSRLGPIRATLDDNTLTFEIPAFTAPPNADLRGEVDYLPYREH